MEIVVTEFTPQSKIKNPAKREEVILEYLPLVKYIAYRIAGRLPSHLEVDDLINSGLIGLMDAMQKFDPSKKIKFKTYAEFRIRGAILDELRNLDWVPRSLRQKINRVENAFKSLESQLGRPAEDEEVAFQLDMPVEEFQKILDESKGLSLISIEDIRVDEDENGRTNLLTFLADKTLLNPADSYNLDQVYHIVANTIDELPEKERLVISLYYYDELTMKEIGEILNVTESRVSQIHTKAIIRLRNKLKSEIVQ